MAAVRNTTAHREPPAKHSIEDTQTFEAREYTRKEDTPSPIRQNARTL